MCAAIYFAVMHITDRILFFKVRKGKKYRVCRSIAQRSLDGCLLADPLQALDLGTKLLG